jgi:glycosyltransferase involved in cell wall biosynthesis
MPALIEHGVTGFLADDERDFERYLQRVDEIEPEACRLAAEERFSAAVMAERYLGLYEEAIVRSRGASPVAA